MEGSVGAALRSGPDTPQQLLPAHIARRPTSQGEGLVCGGACSASLKSWCQNPGEADTVRSSDLARLLLGYSTLHTPLPPTPPCSKALVLLDTEERVINL